MNDFAKCLTDFFLTHLPQHQNASSCTIRTYRNAFKLLFKYCTESRSIRVEQITMNLLTAEFIKGFLDWLESERNNCASTRNNRLAAIHAFFRYVQGEEPQGIYQFQQVISIPTKKTQGKIIEYLSSDAVTLILQQPDKLSRKGRRHLTLLSTLYDTGARVQELINLKVSDISFVEPAVIQLLGKGDKMRRVPLMKNTAELLKHYIAENNLKEEYKSTYPLFSNSRMNKLTRKGITYILNKYAMKAHAVSHTVPEHITPHWLRHSKAMHLLKGGVNLIYIRDLLGHANIKTTEIYARADTNAQREAIEKACPDIICSDMPDWSKDEGLLSWLSSLE